MGSQTTVVSGETICRVSTILDLKTNTWRKVVVPTQFTTRFVGVRTKRRRTDSSSDDSESPGPAGRSRAPAPTVRSRSRVSVPAARSRTPVTDTRSRSRTTTTRFRAPTSAARSRRLDSDVTSALLKDLNVKTIVPPPSGGPDPVPTVGPVPDPTVKVHSTSHLLLLVLFLFRLSRFHLPLVALFLFRL